MREAAGGNLVMGKGCRGEAPLCIRFRRRGSGPKQRKGAVSVLDGAGEGRDAQNTRGSASG